MNHDEMDLFLRGALELEGSIMERSQSIREASKTAYGTGLTDARLLCVALIYQTIKCKELIPGIATEQISKQLQLTTLFIQGMTVSEALISEGQYAKAATALKQDYEIFVRILEIQKGVAKERETPQIRNAPKHVKHYYGQLNNVAHPSNSEALDQILERYSRGNIKGVSPLPCFVKETALWLYELHVWLCFEIAREAVKLLMTLYGEDDKGIRECLEHFVYTLQPAMLEAGFKEVNDESDKGT